MADDGRQGEGAGDEQAPFQIPIAFIGMEDTLILFANHVVVQHYREEFILTFGQLSPPLLLGSEDEQKEQARQTPYVAIKVAARIGMNRARLEELIAALQSNLEKFDRKRGVADGDDV